MKYYRTSNNRHIYWRNDDGMIRYCTRTGIIDNSDLNYNRGAHKLIPLTFNYMLNIDLDGMDVKYKEYVLKVLKELIHEHKS